MILDEGTATIRPEEQTATKSAPGADALRLVAGSVCFLLLLLFWVRWADAKQRSAAVRAWDFGSFYIAAHVDFDHLYSSTAFDRFGRERLAPLGMLHYPAYVRPAVFALPLRPLALFSFWTAYWMWVAVGIAAYFAAVYLILRWLGLPLYLVAPFGAFMPAIFGVITGQDPTIYTLLMALALILLVRKSDVGAGLLLGLCAYKFNLLFLVPFVLVAHRRWKALGAMAGAIGAEAAISALLASPGSYVAILRAVGGAHNLGNLFGGLRGLLILLDCEKWFAPLAVVGLVACIYLIFRLPLREGFCIALAGALLLGYKSAWYDRSLLIIPFAILIATCGRTLRIAVYALLLLAPLWMFAVGLPLNVVVETGLLLVFALGRYEKGDTLLTGARVPAEVIVLDPMR